MAYGVVGGVTVKILRSRRVENEKNGGPQRTLSGTLRGGPTWSKRAWEWEVYAADDSEAGVIRAATSETAAVSCSGDIMGGTVSCRVEVTDEEWVRRDVSHYRVISLSLREV